MTAEASSMWHRLWTTRLRDLIRGQVDGSLDWRQEISAAELPANVRGVVEQVVRGTRLWRREKVGVARELIAHFQDGLETGCSAEQLVASFGDPQQAARLIRRAKKRGRPVVWHLWRWFFWALAAFVVGYLVLGVYLSTSRPTIKTDYLAMINEQAEAAPEAERAWPLYRQALNQMMVARQLPAWSDNTKLGPSDADWPAAVAWLKDHETALQLARDAAQRPKLGFPLTVSPKGYSVEDQHLFYEPSDPALDPRAPKLDQLEDRMLVSALLPHLNPLQSIAKQLSIDARRATSAGDGETALADVRAMLGLAEQIEESPCLIVTIRAADTQRLAFATIQDVIRDRPELWTPGQLRDLAHAIAAANIDWRRGFEGERAMFYDIIQRFYTDDGQGDGRLAFRGPQGMNVFDAYSRFSNATGQPGDWSTNDGLAMLAMPALNMLAGSRKESAELYEELINDALVRIETPLWKQREIPTLDIDVSSEQDGGLASFRYRFVQLLIPAYDKVRNRIAMLNGERDGVLLGIALELYHREHKSWPKSLDELSPRWLPAVPVDRVTGKPLGYKVVDDRPVVYSVGVDRDDDGGRKPPDRDEHDQLDPALASPTHFQPQPATEWQHDGDWVIWSTVRGE